MKAINSFCFQKIAMPIDPEIDYLITLLINTVCRFFQIIITISILIQTMSLSFPFHSLQLIAMFFKRESIYFLLYFLLLSQNL